MSAGLGGDRPPETASTFGPLHNSAESEPDVEAALNRARSLAPIVWLLGKVQSGKTSIVRALTQSTLAEIGDGFRPCTRSSSVYEFPAEAPVLRFLDTRGLDEVGYDPSDDLAFGEKSAHLVLVTMRAMDTQQRKVLDAVRKVRKRHPDWPIVVAQTNLHEGYAPRAGHVEPYPFNVQAPDEDLGRVPADLLRSLAFQRALFQDVPGPSPVFVPLDLTKPEDGLAPLDYGLDELTEALASVAPQGLLLALAAMPGFAVDPKARKADPVVMGHAMVAAGGDLIPLPAAGTVAATTVQARMLSELGKLYGIAWDRRAFGELTAALGAGTLLRVASGVGLRQLAKLLPVYGQTVGAAAAAASSFAITYALGKAATYYLHRRRLGSADAKGVAQVYHDALREAFRIARERRRAANGEGTKP